MLRIFGPAVVGALLALAAPADAQQVPDTTFRFANPQPAYARSTGPRVCIDAAHRNFHTMQGRYRAFTTMLEQDGYRVRSNEVPFAADALRACDIVVIANPASINRSETGGYPHDSALNESELSALVTWIWGGGSLLLIADHAPVPGAEFALATSLGFTLFDGYVAASDSAMSPAVFGAADESVYRLLAQRRTVSAAELQRLAGAPGILGNHVILRGRNPRESVSTVVTFTGTAFHGARDVEPLLIWGRDAVGAAYIGFNVPEAKAPDDGPVTSFAGWLHGGVRRVGAGRVALLGEAAMCSAQWAGEQRVPMGMNAPYASQNAQFCLNVVRWLSGALQ
ncbi:MAG: hypothetical protein HY561_09710 [Gemmatimonadetes bacterium]|nr:hypothetical protein [Gemmatimonadota bacterium]